MTTSIDAISPITGITGIGGGQRVSRLDRLADQSVFGSIFQSAIQNVKDTDAEKTQTQYLLSTGQLDNPAALGIASAKAEISLNLLIQLRNKALDAYSELTRISL